MTRGRRPLVDQIVRKRVNVPESLTMQVDLVLTDPLTGLLNYNSWSVYINKLIRDDLAKEGESVLMTMMKET